MSFVLVNKIYTVYTYLDLGMHIALKTLYTIINKVVYM